jgi:hypothetical protein
MARSQDAMSKAAHICCILRHWLKEAQLDKHPGEVPAKN